MLVAADREVGVVADPRGLHRRSEGRLPSGLQFAQADSRSNGAIHPGVIVELAVDHDLAGRFTDEPQLRHRATLLGKLRALAPQSFEEFVDQRETPAIHRTGIDVRFRGGEEFQNVIDLRLVFLHLLPVCFAVFKEGPHLVLRRAVEQTAVLAKQPRQRPALCLPNTFAR